MSKGVLQLVALSFLLASCSRDPSQRKLSYLNSGDAYAAKGKYQEAVIQYRNAIQIDQKYAAAHYHLGRAYLALGNPEAAFREFNNAVDLDPGNSDARLSLASLEISRRQFDAAQSAIQAVLKAEPANPHAHSVMAREFLATHNLSSAIGEFEKMLEIDPGAVSTYISLGATYVAAGRPGDAERAYKEAIKVSPGSPEAEYALGEFYLAQHRLPEAETESRKAVELDPKGIPPKLFLGRILIAEGHLSDAEKIFAQVKSSSPDDVRAYTQLGMFYSSTGQKEKAVTEFRSLAAAKPNDPEAKLLLIETLLDLNRLEEAAPVLQALVGKSAKEKGKENPQLQLLYGRVLSSQGKYAEAAAILQKVITEEPDSASGHYYLGVAQKGLGQLSQAKASFAKGLDLAPKMNQASVALANLDVKDGSHQEALKQADRAIDDNPAGGPGYVARARALMAKGDSAQATAAVEEALRRDPLNQGALATLLSISMNLGKTPAPVQRISGLVQQHPGVAGLHFLLALGQLNLKEIDAAEANAKQAMTLDPKTPEIWTLMADVDFARGRNENAKADLRNAIAANPRVISNYTALGAQYERENNWPEAKKYFEKAHDIDRSSPYVTAELAFIYLEHGGDVNVALSLAQTARQGMPNSPMTADALGWAYYKLGSTDLAVKELEQSVQMTPRNPIYQYHLGMAYASARRWDKAAQSLQSALRQDANFPYANTAKAELDQIGQQRR
jgi:tetratricopeptide (TPR) repeat protein